MSDEKQMDLKVREAAPDVLRAHPPAPIGAPDAPQFHTSPWQPRLGNSSIAAAAASVPPNPIDTFSFQYGYGNAFVAHKLIQMKEHEGAPTAALTTAPVSEATPAANPANGPTAELIVEDTAEPTPSQMKKSQFLAELHTAISNAATESLAGTQWESQAGPRITQTFAQYGAQSSRQIEHSIRRYAPETASLATARELIPAITTRFRRTVTIAMATGQVPGMSAAAGVAGMIGSAVSGLANTATTTVSTIGNAIAGIGNIFLKERDSGASGSNDPDTVRAQLGAGQALEGGVRSRMESAFGESFGGVSIHADATAASLSNNMRARAFTVGSDIAFAGGEYRPGTLVGDALIAHELAHVMQQRRGAASDLPAHKGAGDYGALEEDADTAAVGAVAATWNLGKGNLTGLSAKSVRNLKSGLRLQKCDWCGSSSRIVPVAITKFSEVQRIWPTLRTQAERDAALSAVIPHARQRATELFRTAESNPILGIRQRIESTTGVTLEHNPLIGVYQDNVEQAYRSWAEGAGVEPWILLAVWKKEGLGSNRPGVDPERRPLVQSAPGISAPRDFAATSGDRAKSLYRSWVYYWRMGIDHFMHFTPRPGDNAASFTDADAPNHETAFRNAISAQVRAGRLPRDISAEINAELTATPVGPDRFSVTPTNRFFTLSLMLVGAYYRENEAAVAADPRIGANPDPGMVYMRWNLGATRFEEFMTSAEGHRVEPAHRRPEGGAPSVTQWALETRVASNEYGQPRNNAIRVRYFVEVFKLIYEGW